MSEEMNLAEELQITMQCDDVQLINSEIHEFQLIYAEKTKLCRSQAPSILVSCLQQWPELCQRSHNPQNADVTKPGDGKPAWNLNTAPPEAGLNPEAQGSCFSKEENVYFFQSAVYCDLWGEKADLNGVY